MLKQGDRAPDFSAQDSAGKPVKLSDFAGRKVVLYFYPKDDTPGCTKEACSFRDSDAVYKEHGITVLGVSLDDGDSHKAFASKFSLPFTLLADTDHSVSEAYGVYGEQEWKGNKYMGVARKTFLIDEAGKLKKIFDTVDVDRHSDEVLAAFAA